MDVVAGIGFAHDDVAYAFAIVEPSATTTIVVVIYVDTAIVVVVVNISAEDCCLCWRLRSCSCSWCR